MSWEDIGEVAMWPNKEKTGRQPDVRGHVEVNGHKYPMSLWKSTSDHPDAPAYWGKVQRDPEKQPLIGSAEHYQPPQQQQQRDPAPPPPDDDFDDDIPF